MTDDIDLESLNLTEPADRCGICDAPVDDPVGYRDPSGRVFRFFVDRFDTALPNGDLHITMCEDCHDHLSELEIDPALRGSVDIEQNWNALRPILEDVPPKALYWTNLTRMV